MVNKLRIMEEELVQHSAVCDSNLHCHAHLIEEKLCCCFREFPNTDHPVKQLPSLNAGEMESKIISN